MTIRRLAIPLSLLLMGTVASGAAADPAAIERIVATYLAFGNAAIDGFITRAEAATASAEAILATMHRKQFKQIQSLRSSTRSQITRDKMSTARDPDRTNDLSDCFNQAASQLKAIRSPTTPLTYPKRDLDRRLANELGARLLRIDIAAKAASSRP